MSGRQIFFVARLVILYPGVCAAIAYAFTTVANTLLGIGVAPIHAAMVVLGVWYLSILLDAKAFARKVRDL